MKVSARLTEWKALPSAVKRSIGFTITEKAPTKTLHSMYLLMDYVARHQHALQARPNRLHFLEENNIKQIAERENINLEQNQCCKEGGGDCASNYVMGQAGHNNKTKHDFTYLQSYDH